MTEPHRKLMCTHTVHVLELAYNVYQQYGNPQVHVHTKHQCKETLALLHAVHLLHGFGHGVHPLHKVPEGLLPGREADSCVSCYVLEDGGEGGGGGGAYYDGRGEPMRKGGPWQSHVHASEGTALRA